MQTQERSSGSLRRKLLIVVAGAFLVTALIQMPAEAGLKQKIKSAWNKLRKAPTPKPAGNQALRTGAAPARPPTAMAPNLLNRPAAPQLSNSGLAPIRIVPPAGRPAGVANAVRQAPPTAAGQTQWNRPMSPQAAAPVTTVGNSAATPVAGSPRRAMENLKTQAKPDIFGKVALPPPPTAATPANARSAVRTPIVYERLPPRPQVNFALPAAPVAPVPVTPVAPAAPQPVIYSKLPGSGPVSAGGGAAAIARSRNAPGATPVTQISGPAGMVPREALVNAPNVGQWTTKDVSPGAAPQTVIGARPHIRGAGPDALLDSMKQASARSKQAMEAAARTSPSPTPLAQIRPGLQKAVGSGWNPTQPLYGQLRMPSLSGNVSPVTASRFNAEYQAILRRTQVTTPKSPG